MLGESRCLMQQGVLDDLDVVIEVVCSANCVGIPRIL
jgi:hypothetical protein